MLRSRNVCLVLIADSSVPSNCIPFPIANASIKSLKILFFPRAGSISSTWSRRIHYPQQLSSDFRSTVWYNVWYATAVLKLCSAGHVRINRIQILLLGLSVHGTTWIAVPSEHNNSKFTVQNKLYTINKNGKRYKFAKEVEAIF